MTASTFLKIDALIRPVKYHGARFYIAFASLLAVVAWGVYAWSVQLTTGLGVTGLRTVVWGFYIINFVFFIGISHVGALISAILRLTGSDWRRPITRIAEAVTFASLFVAMLMPLIDLGRPDRILNLLMFGRIQSPLIWDFIAIGTYFVTSTLYLYVPMIPDIAVLRDSLKDASSWRRRLYSLLSLNWIGTPEQWRILEQTMRILTILIVFMVITVHTVVSWDFAMTLRVGWNSTIFGPYFVAGAVLSGVATVVIIMALIRRLLGLEAFITEKHLNTMAKLMLALVLTLIYLTINEHLVVGYKYLGTKELEGVWLSSLFWGTYAPYFWVQVVGGLIVPAFLLAYPGTRNLKGYLAASILVNIGMWLERWNIVVPSLAVPQLPYPWGTYIPTWVELSITAGAFSLFMLIYLAFTKLFPIVSIWETVGHEQGSAALAAEPYASPVLRLIVPHPEAQLERPIEVRRSAVKTFAIAAVGLIAGLVGGAQLKSLIRALSSGRGVVTPLRRSLDVLGIASNMNAFNDLGLSVRGEALQKVGSAKLTSIRYNRQAALISLAFQDPSIRCLTLYDEPVSVLVLIQRIDDMFGPPETILPNVTKFALPRGGVALLNEKTSPPKLEMWEDHYKVSIFGYYSAETLKRFAMQIEEVIMK
ncbi:MAG: NrfD/PsrC family molybdoenzyme membrane anchor subunit [Thermosphaera sp.]